MRRNIAKTSSLDFRPRRIARIVIPMVPCEAMPRCFAANRAAVSSDKNMHPASSCAIRSACISPWCKLRTFPRISGSVEGCCIARTRIRSTDAVSSARGRCRDTSVHTASGTRISPKSFSSARQSSSSKCMRGPASQTTNGWGASSVSTQSPRDVFAYKNFRELRRMGFKVTA